MSSEFTQRSSVVWTNLHCSSSVPAAMVACILSWMPWPAVGGASELGSVLPSLPPPPPSVPGGVEELDDEDDDEQAARTDKRSSEKRGRMVMVCSL
jgi:hypothetical protein